MSRELDAKVAEILGWTDFLKKTETCWPEFDVTATPPDWDSSRYHRVPEYSSDISVAQAVINAKCWTDKDGCSRVYWRFWNTPHEWYAEIRKCGHHLNQVVWKYESGVPILPHEGGMEKLAEAICRAALTARTEQS